MRSRSESGAAAVEMAFMTILLIWLVLGTVDMGRAISTNIALQEAAQAGVAHASFTEDATVATVKQTAIASTDTPSLTPDDIDVACVPVSRSQRDGARVRVVARHDLNLVTPLIGQVLGGSIELSKLVEAERFYDSCVGA